LIFFKAHIFRGFKKCLNYGGEIENGKKCELQHHSNGLGLAKWTFIHPFLV
jgi:hypothetical protein